MKVGDLVRFKDLAGSLMIITSVVSEGFKCVWSNGNLYGELVAPESLLEKIADADEATVSASF